MLGYMCYNRFGHAGFTDRHKGRSTAGVQTCAVCLLRFDARGGTLPDGTVLEEAEWIARVCTQIKDDTANGGYQAGCAACVFPAA
ncbi:hypothetical protein [Paraburkholderia rhynchosiae]|uniref:Uncharacterized protein n=1 Tax=Paraburkholderia rhynchosiae TaxID=487049 RepID=A0A2N7W079_9BURK|nr:hypothetical protein [Paraburkholderia rhynchosiae]PMS22783.1 hypothetical protein C0Z16_32840 [Paraburkholderia rhynchosiae]CAB3741075.1 hypothetical protein LMG27174_06713 [Paraburkholderia rhynchosiae]